MNEINNVKKAIEISRLALNATLKIIKPGVSTEKEIRNFLEFKMLESGATKIAFDSIVVSGIRGSMPHGVPGDNIIKNGELLTIDFGADFAGFKADITRTFKIGEIQNDKLNEIFDIVKHAQKIGIMAIKPGIKTSEIDKICREYITNKGYGEYFSHGTGHGLGIEIHEEPYVTSQSTSTLEIGNIITVEPGIYIPGLGGVRFEDDILVTKNGYKVLSKHIGKTWGYK